MNDSPREEEKRIILDVACRIYSELMGALDAETQFGKHYEVSGTEIYKTAARQAFHRAEWFIEEYREWKTRVDRPV